MDRAFAAASVLAGVGTAAGAWVAQSGIGANYIVVAAFFFVILCALIGMKAREYVEGHQRGEIARVFSATRPGLAQDRTANRREKSPMESLTQAMQAMASHAWRASMQRNAPGLWSHDVTLELAARGKRSSELAASMAEDARVIAAATSGTQRLERELTEQLQHMRGLTEDAGSTSAAVAAKADQLADAVRAVTAQAENAAGIASRLAETAFAAQQNVASIGVSGTAAMTAAASVQAVFALAESLAAQVEGASAENSAVATGVRALAKSGAGALGNMLETVRDMNDQCTEAMLKLRALADIIDEQSEFGHALSHAAMAQADAVRRLLFQLDSAQAETEALQQRASEFCLPETRLGSDVTAQRAVERLPTYADAMAQLLRGLPEYQPASATRRDVAEMPGASAPQ